MAIVSMGYDGPITEPQIATIVPDSGSALFGVDGGGDWQVTAHPTLAGVLNIAPGAGWGPMVRDVSDAIAQVAQTSLPGTGQSRWDLVAMRRDWRPSGGLSGFVIVDGSATKALPEAAAAVSGTGRQIWPGQVHDQPIALVQWVGGQSKPAVIVDLRTWAANGGVLAKDTLVHGAMDQVGSKVRIGGDEWFRELDANGSPVWTNLDAPGPWMALAPGNDWVVPTGTAAQCRLISRGKLLEVRAFLSYGGSETVVPGWIAARFPAGMAPSRPYLDVALTDGSKRLGSIWVGPQGIELGPETTGKTVHMATVVPFG
ncbi:hypothetical protein [Sinomonas soli]